MNRVGNMFESTEEQCGELNEAAHQVSGSCRAAIDSDCHQGKGKNPVYQFRRVVAVLAEGNYVSLQQESSSYLLRESISDSPPPKNGVVFFQQPVEIGPS